MVEKFNVEYIPGGATQNSIRVAQVYVFSLLILFRYIIIIGKILFKFAFEEIESNLVT